MNQDKQEEIHIKIIDKTLVGIQTIMKVNKIIPSKEKIPIWRWDDANGDICIYKKPITIEQEEYLRRHGISVIREEGEKTIRVITIAGIKNKIIDNCTLSHISIDWKDAISNYRKIEKELAEKYDIECTDRDCKEIYEGERTEKSIEECNKLKDHITDSFLGT